MHIEQETAQEPRTSSYIAMVLILSLLIHILMVLFLLFYQHYDKSIDQKLQQLLELIEAKTQHNMPLTKEEEEQLEQYKQWVAGNAQGGAQVIFKDEPEESEQETADEHKDAAQSMQEAQPEKLSEEVAENKDSKSEEPQVLKDEAQELRMPPSLTTIFEERNQTVQSKTKDKKEAEKDNIEQLQDDQKNTQKKPEKKVSDQQPKKITMADITQGFMNHINQRGEHHVTVIGANQGRVTQEQLKYERYIQKIFACIQTSERIYHHKMNFHEKNDVHADINLALDRSGKMVGLNLVRSTGYRDLDDYILFVYQDASSSFPPVPHYIKEDPFTISIRQFVKQERF